MLLLGDPRRGQIVGWNGGDCLKIRGSAGIASVPDVALACSPGGVGLLATVAEGLSWRLQR